MSRYNIRNMLGEIRIFITNYCIAYIPSHHIRLWYYRNIMKFKIAHGASIHIGCKFSCAQHFELGETSTINQNCHIDNRGGISIGANVNIASRCALITADHLIDSPYFEGRNRPITIKDYSFLGYGVTVLGGVLIENGCVIGANSLVYKSTVPYHLYAGNPAKKLKARNQNLNYTTTYRRLFH